MGDCKVNKKKMSKKLIENDFSLLERLKLEANLAMNAGQPGANRFDSKAEHFEKGQPREAKTGMEVLVIEDKANDGWKEDILMETSNDFHTMLQEIGQADDCLF